MGRFFNLENPIWRFIGNLADFFIVSMLVSVLHPGSDRRMRHYRLILCDYENGRKQRRLYLPFLPYFF